MGSLEQQMALFEELISQEQQPVLVPQARIRGHLMQQGHLVSLQQAPPGRVPMLMTRPPVSAAVMSSSVVMRGVQPLITTVVSTPKPQTVSVPSLETIALPSSTTPSTPPAPERIPLPPAPAPPPDLQDHQPPPKKLKTTPRLYEKESESLELKAAIAKATAAANATNSKNYPLPQMRNDSYPQPSQPQRSYSGPTQHGSNGPMSGPPRPPGMPSQSMGGPPRAPRMNAPRPMVGPGPPPEMGPWPHLGPSRTPVFPSGMNGGGGGAPAHISGNDAIAQAEAANKIKEKKPKKSKKIVRTAAGEVWEDNSLLEWDDNDFRIFVGDIGNECNDEMLYRAFSKYPSLVKVKVIRDKRSNKTKGYGFASFKDSGDYIKAMREVNGKYIGNRPCKLRKSTWKDRQLSVVKKKNNEKQKLGLKI